MSSAQPVIGVLALQGGVAEHLSALDRAGAIARPIRRPGELAAVDGLVLPGGESTTMTRLLAAFELEEPLRDRLAAGMPAFGSCAGMIMLSREVCDGGVSGVRPLGALDIVVRRNAFGSQVESFEADLDFEGIEGGPVHGVFIRAPWVEKAGREVRILATVPETAGPDTAGPAAAGTEAVRPHPAVGRIVAVRQGPVLATAFHPELVNGDERVHRHFVETVRAC